MTTKTRNQSVNLEKNFFEKLNNIVSKNDLEIDYLDNKIEDLRIQSLELQLEKMKKARDKLRNL